MHKALFAISIPALLLAVGCQSDSDATTQPATQPSASASSAVLAGGEGWDLYGEAPLDATAVPSLVQQAKSPADVLAESGSLDGKPVRLVVLLASPVDRTPEHINALAKIS
ncbi:MAG: hypothetical protein AAGK78_10680, partial [Planctomycetota bacterium]